MMSTGPAAAAPIDRLSRRTPSGGAAMGSSTTTTSAARDQARAQRPATSSRCPCTWATPVTTHLTRKPELQVYDERHTAKILVP